MVLSRSNYFMEAKMKEYSIEWMEKRNCYYSTTLMAESKQDAMNQIAEDIDNIRTIVGPDEDDLQSIEIIEVKLI